MVLVLYCFPQWLEQISIEIFDVVVDADPAGGVSGGGDSVTKFKETLGSSLQFQVEDQALSRWGGANRNGEGASL